MAAVVYKQIAVNQSERFVYETVLLQNRDGPILRKSLSTARNFWKKKSHWGKLVVESNL